MLTMSHYYIADLQEKVDFKNNRYAVKKNPEKIFQRKALCCANKCSSKIPHCLQQIKTMEKPFC